MSLNIIMALFIEGVLSFFSPCVLPLIPLYIGYLTSGSKEVDENGVVSFKKGKVLATTVFFILGISTVFVLIALSVSSVSTIMSNYSILFSSIGGMVLIFFGLMAMKIVEVPFLNKTHKLPFNIDLNNMNFMSAYILGFLFSFTWTPCIGPMLASAIIKAASASSRMVGMAYIGVYTLGFILMFLLLGLFTESILSLLKKHQNIVNKTGILAGAIIIALGVNMIFTSAKEIDVLKNSVKTEAKTESNNTGLSDIENHNFTLKNGKGESISLKDYKGKIVVLTFYGTWCPYCNKELPVLADLDKNRDDIEVILIATPNDGKETNIEGVEAFMKEKGYSFNILYDEDYSIKAMYKVGGYPTTFVYKTDGSMLGYIPGYVDKEMMDEILLGATK